MSIFTGSAVAIVTPFTEDGKINYPVLKDLIEFQLANGTDAIAITATTGEVPALSDEDQFECIRFAVETVNKRVPVIAGAGSNVTSHAIYLAQGAEKLGADAVLVVTPYYNKTTQKGLVAHYKAISDSINIPIIVYSVSGRTGLNVTPQTCLELSKIEHVVGIKEASGNMSQIAQIAELCGDNFDIYSGNDDQTLPILSLGGKGVISVLANVMPKEVHEMCHKYFEGDVKGSREIFLRTLCLANDLFIEVNPVPVKAALNEMGKNVGPCIAPLIPMEEANLAKLRATMRHLGLIK